MSFRVSGKNLDVGEALRDRINDRIVEIVRKYFDGGYSGHATLTRDGFGFRTECVLHLDSGAMLEAEGMAAYSRLQQAEFASEKFGYSATRHQREVGTGYFDLVSTTITGGTSSTTALHDSTEAAQFKAHGSEIQVQAAE